MSSARKTQRRASSTARDTLDAAAVERDLRVLFVVANSSLGSVLVASSDRGVCAVMLGDDPRELEQELRQRFPRAHIVAGDELVERLASQVVSLVEAPRGVLDLPLDLHGTPFQLQVWRALREIPSGATITYAELAERIGAPKSVRAVGSACGSNPVAVVIPCHRVLRADGKLSGYRWGVERKRELLRREQRSVLEPDAALA